MLIFMRYLILILALVSCHSEPKSNLWSIKNACIKLGNQLDAKVIRMFDEENNDQIDAVCEIGTSKTSIHWLRNQEVEGAVRGILMYKNKDLYKNLNKCLKRRGCKDYKSSKYHECASICKARVGWND